jgi:hypothetical protein
LPRFGIHFIMERVDMDKEQIIQLMAEAGLKTPARGDFIFIHWDQIAMLLAHEREQCALVCEGIENDQWALYKGRPPYKGNEDGRADTHVHGVSDGAGMCAAAIRARSQE